MRKPPPAAPPGGGRGMPAGPPVPRPPDPTPPKKDGPENPARQTAGNSFAATGPHLDRRTAPGPPDRRTAPGPPDRRTAPGPPDRRTAPGPPDRRTCGWLHRTPAATGKAHAGPPDRRTQPGPPGHRTAGPHLAQNRTPALAPEIVPEMYKSGTIPARFRSQGTSTHRKEAAPDRRTAPGPK